MQEFLANLFIKREKGVADMVKIQSAMRMHLKRVEYKSLRRKVIKVQAFYRMHRERDLIYP